MNNREIIENLLTSTGREGITDLLQYMRTSGFYTSPCSGAYHLCCEGGLTEHSLNVHNSMFDMAIGLKFITEFRKENEGMTELEKSMHIVSLLHDVGKMGQYNKPNYVPNMIKSRKKDEGLIRSENKPFITNPELLAIPHEIRSVQMVSQFIELTEHESFAILHHNGMYGDLKYQLKDKETPLQILLHFADLWCSRVIEV